MSLKTLPTLLLCLSLLLVGCQTASEPTALPTPTAPPPTLTVAPTAPPVEPPSQPTAVSTAPVPTSAPPTALPEAPVEAIQFQWVVDGFFKPLALTHAGDERLFVVEQHGLISIVQNGQRLATPFLDLIEIVNSTANEQGLLGLAFHPRYAENGHFFINYTAQDGATVVARYRVSAADPNRAEATSGQILLRIPQPYRNHNGGQIGFGPDGYLYIGMGDGGDQNDPQNRAQNPTSLLGKLLRLDVDNVPEGASYAIPPDNPFVTDGNARPEIWALGLRNPWRFSFDRLTGDLFISDVGQNVWEEINFQPATSAGGENYGWKIFEGAHCHLGDCATPNLIPPVAEYSHAEGHCSVTGGHIYRGQASPTLWGNYFFADYCSGVVWRLFANGDGSWDMATVGRTGFLVSSFGEAADGELYILDQTGGAVYRLVP